MFKPTSTTPVLLVAVLAFAGCSSNDDGFGKVTGTVLVDGQPASAGLRIDFDPVTKGVRGSSAVTDDSGQYEAIYSLSRNGVRQGDVVIKLMKPEIPPPAPGKKPKLPFPEEYYEEIQQVNIGPGQHTIDLEISKTGA